MKEKKKRTFWKDFGLGFKSYGRAFKLCFTTKMALAFIVPFILLILLIFGGWEFKGMIHDYITDWAEDSTTLSSIDQTWWVTALIWLIEFIVWLVVNVLFFLIFAYIGGYAVLIVMSPLLGYLSEKTEEIELGFEYPFDFQQLARDILRGIWIAIRNMLIELLLVLAVFIISYVPVIGWIASVFGWVFLFFVASYFYGFSFIDYSIERRRLSVRKSVKLVRKHKGVAIANGMIYAFVMLIPYIGIILATFFAIISVVAGAISMNEIFQKEEEYVDLPRQIIESKKKKLNAKN